MKESNAVKLDKTDDLGVDIVNSLTVCISTADMISGEELPGAVLELYA